jgi:hypothetical protein
VLANANIKARLRPSKCSLEVDKGLVDFLRSLGYKATIQQRPKMVSFICKGARIMMTSRGFLLIMGIRDTQQLLNVLISLISGGIYFNNLHLMSATISGQLYQWQRKLFQTCCLSASLSAYRV